MPDKKPRKKKPDNFVWLEDLSKIVAGKHFLVGIDYSMCSPGICIYECDFSRNKKFSEWDPQRCRFYYRCKSEKRKIITAGNPYITGDVFEKNVLCNEERFVYQVRWVTYCIPDVCNTAVLIEDYAFAGSGVNFQIGELTGHLKNRLWNYDIPFKPVNIVRVKKFATGNGNAKKPELEQAFIKDTGWNLQKLFGVEHLKNKSPVTDLIDAYWLCKIAFEAWKKAV